MSSSPNATSLLIASAAGGGSGVVGGGGAGGRVWRYESADRYNTLQGGLGLGASVWGGAVGGGGGGILTPAQLGRLERIRQSRMLFRGDHAGYYLAEGRTQFAFRGIRTESGRVAVPYVKLNAIKLAIKKTGDLLFGAAPLLKAGDEDQQAAIDDLMVRSRLHLLLRNTAVECCTEGEAYLESVVMGGKTYLRRVMAEHIMPDLSEGGGELMPDGQYRAYVGYRLANLGTAERPVMVALRTQWLPGRIVRELLRLDKDGRPAGKLPLAVWPAYAAAAERGEAIVGEVTETGIPENTITYIANDEDHDEPVSDIDGNIEYQDVINHKITQLAVAIAKHQDPKLAVPRRAAGADGNLAASAEVYYFDESAGDNALPRYITWDGQTDAAMTDRSFGLNALLISMEMSPVLVGLSDGAAPEKYQSLRLRATNTLAMVARKAVAWRAAVERALRVTQMMELRLPGTYYPLAPVGVELRDGLPIDSDQQASEIATLRAAGVMSTEAALERLYEGDLAAVAKELARILAERETNQQQGLLGELYTKPGGANPPTAGGEDPGSSGGDPSTSGGSDPAQSAGAGTNAASGQAAPVDQPLNGAQVTSAVDMLVKIRTGEVVPEAARELLSAIGIPTARVEKVVKATVAAGDLPSPAGGGATGNPTARGGETGGAA